MVTAVDQNQNIMAFRHKQFDVQGIQFHPESILTPCGEQIISNWLQATA
jgi:anthranilate synthase component 2